VAKAQLDTANNKFDTSKGEAQQTLDAAQARVEQAEAVLKNAEVNRTQDALKVHDVTAARAAVKQAEAGLKSAQASEVQNALKQDDVSATRAALKQAQSSLDSARAGAYQIGMREKDITQAQAQATRSESSVTNARTQLGYTTITAPRDGIVMKKYIDPGSIVTAGRSSLGGSGAGVALVDLADVSRMFVLVNVDETDIARIELEQEVDITIDAYPNELFTGYVTKISPQTVAEQNVTTVPVTVEIEAPDLRLKPGMNATCDFITAKRIDVLRVPNSAVNEGERGMTVTVMEGGAQVTRPVEAGLSDNDYTEIMSGLKEGETIVTQIVQPRNNNNTQPGNRRRPMGPF
jgi:HlyD family secretion protein